MIKRYTPRALSWLVVETYRQPTTPSLGALNSTALEPAFRPSIWSSFRYAPWSWVFLQSLPDRYWAWMFAHVTRSEIWTSQSKSRRSVADVSAQIKELSFPREGPRVPVESRRRSTPQKQNCWALVAGAKRWYPENGKVRKIGRKSSFVEQPSFRFQNHRPWRPFMPSEAIKSYVRLSLLSLPERKIG